jgi:hypothetical protein
MLLLFGLDKHGNAKAQMPPRNLTPSHLYFSGGDSYIHVYFDYPKLGSEST